jgi:CheY-like chemotaxis protein
VPELSPGGTVGSVLSIATDVTERRLADELLRDADRRKDEFLATLAHELRNPLAPIRNALQIMDLTVEPETHRNARGIIGRQLKQMVHLIDDLLDVSRISQGKVELRRQHVDIEIVVQTAIETTRPAIDAAKHELIVRLPAPKSLIVDADLTRLAQIIANLLHNAAKYTRDGGRIEVAVEQQGTNAVISVQDSGVGIPVEMLPRVFDMFAQVDRSLERSQGGLGIGLALVKSLVEMHGGTVAAFSAGQDRGSKFTVTIPLVAAPASIATTSRPITHELHASSTNGVRVLVVDDNFDSADSLSCVLQVMGYQTRIAHDGIEAIRAADDYRPGIILLDLGLPKMNGLEVAGVIRDSDWGKHTLLIALSGWGQEEDRRKTGEAGFDFHFVKPVDIAALTDIMTTRAPRLQ